MTPRIGMLGAGRAAAALALAWQQRGMPLVGVWNRTLARAQRLAQQAHTRSFTDPEALISACDVLVLAVADDAIALLAQKCAGYEVVGRVFLHLSGARDATVLAPLRDAGAHVGTLHPVVVLAGEAAAASLTGAAFAVEYDDAPTHDVIMALVEPLTGRVLYVPRGQKARYHAALCLLSDYTVTLYGTAAWLLEEMGMGADDVRHALLALLGSTLANLAREGDEALDVYRVLARSTLAMAQARGTDTDVLRRLLEKEDA